MITIQQSLLPSPNKKDIKPRQSNQATTNQTQTITKDEFKHANSKKHHPKKEKPHLALLVGTLTAGLLLIAGIAKRKELQQWWHSFHTQPKPSPQPTTTVPIPPPIIPPISLTLEERIQEQLRLAEEVFGKLGIQFTKQEKVELLTSDKPTEAIWQFAKEKIEIANNRPLEKMAWELNYRDETDFSRAYGRFDLNLGFGLTLSEDQRIKLADNIEDHKRFGLIRLRKFIYQTNFLGNTLKESNREFDQIYTERIQNFLTFSKTQPIRKGDSSGMQDYYNYRRTHSVEILQEICNNVQQGQTTLTGKKMRAWFEAIEKLKDSIEPTNLDNREAHVNWSNTLIPDIIFSNAYRTRHPEKIVPRWALKYEPAELFEALKKEALNYLEKIKAFNEP